MKQFIGTFGLGHEHADKFQPILASSKQEAHELMFEKYGNKYAFIYERELFEMMGSASFYDGPLSLLKKGEGLNEFINCN